METMQPIKNQKIIRLLKLSLQMSFQVYLSTQVYMSVQITRIHTQIVYRIVQPADQARA